MVPMNMKKSEKVRDFCEKAYRELEAAGIDELFDDRSEHPCVMFADMELIGAPRMLVVGERDLEKGAVEIRYRATGVRKSVSASEAVATIISEVKAALGELNSKAKPQEE
ncbi:MAG: His/Gly/Thr/Pro-type tRNA ligase C-terminal domain-containing protein [Pseudomonadota bacterium]|nr:His/Gly/Thr/Pro-type tRNA ligase C-terminal domain-containing protein [Pseudomonadota bacterium]